MTAAVFPKLLAIFLTVGLGWLAGRLRWLDSGADARDPARVLGNAAFTIFVPALLFRTTAQLDFAALPWRVIAAFFVPAVLVALAVYVWQRRRPLAGAVAGVAQPAARMVTASFGNSVQMGIPMAAALFGEAGLAIHITLVGLHALILLTLPTVLAETDLARAQPGRPIGATVRATVRSTLVHPAVLPVVAGLAWNLAGLPLPPVLDETLAALGAAVVPVCLVLIGLSLAYYGVQGQWQAALRLVALKLLLMPAVVLVTARWGFGLTGMPLAVVVLMAALPAGSNALIFAQRYETGVAEATAAIVLSTLLFVLSASGWLAVLSFVG